MSEEATIPTIDENSKVADVVTYVGRHLDTYEFVEELQQLIVDQAIDGSDFRHLTGEMLVEYGLKTSGKRNRLLTLVDELKKRWSAPPYLPIARQKRWEDLVSIIPELKADPTVKKPKYVDFRQIKFDQVSRVFNFQTYEQKRIPIPDEEFRLLYNQLSVIRNNYPTNLFLISPIIWCLSNLIPGMEVACKQPISGNAILLRGSFEFLVYQELTPYVGVVAAKQDNMDQELSQLLMGQEVFCETIKSKTFLGVISTFERWEFIRNEPDKIYRDKDNYILHTSSQANGKKIIDEGSL
jgi:hypothetical protein